MKRSRKYFEISGACDLSQKKKMICEDALKSIKVVSSITSRRFLHSNALDNVTNKSQ